MVAIRLLAIANLAYIHTESAFQQKISQQDSDQPRRLQLAQQLSELIHPPGNGESGIPRELQTLAISTLEALAKHKHKAAEVCTALSVNVNHGVLFYVVRKAVAELANDDDPADNFDEDDWREALFSLLITLPSSSPSARTGETMVAAGLLDILVEILTLRTSKAERNHPRVLNFLDNYVYNLRDAFQALINAKGLGAVADLTSYEVETSFVRVLNGDGMPEQYKTKA
ncbi:E3 ubiquitin-protein ligase tom1, partial [Cryomyces antarcticus]